MRSIGFGTWKIPPDDVTGVMEEAIGAGFRHLDTAAAYANEASVGEGIINSGVSRPEMFVSGKLWTTRRAYDAAISACKKSLRSLRLTYFDQYLIHWPAPTALHDNWAEMNAETWRAMETLYQEGLALTIGVCNFTPKHIEALLSQATVAPGVNQIEYHPGWLQAETVAFCREKGIRVEAWSPLGNGELLCHPTLTEIAAAHGRSVAQVCLSWCMAHDVLPVTKTVSPLRMRENIGALSFELTARDVERIDAMPPCAFSGLDPDRVTQFG